jgi:serine/threonine protein kinase
MPIYPSTLRRLMTEGIPPERVLWLFGRLLDGVEAAHLLGVWHRDLKPENVLYDPQADRVVISDFGIAHFAEPLLQTAVETRTGERLANFQYAAPEQRSRGAVDRRADIYALGLILNEMFTGEVLQGPGYKGIESVAPGFAYLDPIVERMVRQAPGERPASIEEIKKELVARGNEFIAFQRLSKLKQTVVPSTEVEDPFISDPVRLVGLDFDGARLHFKLSQQPNALWVEKFRSMGSYSFILGKRPEQFDFRGDEALIPADETDAQKLLDLFKGYVETTNKDYRDHVERLHREQEAAERHNLQERIAAEERRLRVRQSLRL